jgi:hypothetical protein
VATLWLNGVDAAVIIIASNARARWFRQEKHCRGNRRQQRPPEEICKVDAEIGEEVEQVDIIKGYKENTPRELN